MPTFTQTLTVKSPGQHSLPIDCNRFQDYDIKIKSLIGACLPLLTDISFHNTHIKFFVDIEPGETAQVTLTYQCHDEPEKAKMRMPGKPESPYFQKHEKKKQS